jgi:hypothetical protein
MPKDEEKENIYNEVLKWINENDAHFKRNCKPLYDKENLERIKRFANAPMDYIDERIESNKKALESSHKLYLSILLAVFTGFVAILFTQSITSYVNTLNIKYLVVPALLLIGSFLALKMHLTPHILRGIGLLRVIRDSEIEIYYLSKIKEHRKLREKNSEA